MKLRALSCAIAVALASTSYAEVSSQELQSMQKQLEAMQAKIAQLEKSSPAAVKDSEDGIKVGGAVRFGYRYQDNNEHQGGDMRFDTFRLDVSGKVKDLTILSKWRWFQNHKALIQVAEIGYDFNDNHNLKGGLTLVPFGNQEYNSHNFDLSPNFALGLEDTYQFGATYTYNNGGFNVQASLFKNDSFIGGMGDDSYSPTMNAVGGTDAGTVNTGALRIVNNFKISDDFSIELGASGLYAGVAEVQRDSNGGQKSLSNIGERQAYALHSVINVQRLNVQLQATHYEFDLEGSTANTGIGIGYYGGVQNTIATRATSYTANVKYGFPVSWGPIELLELYNDYTLVTDKPGDAKDSYDNALGLGVAAGPVYVFFDWHTQQNMGDMTQAGKEIGHYFNANFGYYF